MVIGNGSIYAKAETKRQILTQVALLLQEVQQVP